MRGFCFLLLAVLIAGGINAQIVAWHFNGANGNEESYDPTTHNQGLITSALVRGFGLHVSSIGRSFSSDQFTINGTKADALQHDDYISFAVSSEHGFLLSVYTLDAKLMRTPGGPSMYRWYYSLNGTDFSPVGESDISLAISAEGIEQPRIALYTNPSLQKVNDVNLVTFRLYAWGATSSAGSLAIGRYAEGNASNSLAINGTVVSGVWQDIDIVDFSGKKEGTKTLLDWVTVNEDKSKGFEVMQSTDGIFFSVIDFVPSSAAADPGLEMHFYHFATETQPGAKYFYQLRHLREDGHNKLSPIIMLKGDIPEKFGIDAVFPNPAEELLNIVVNAPARELIQLIITDISGAMVIQKTIDVPTGSNVIPVNTGHLRAGIYVVKMVCTGYADTFTVKFVKQ